MSRKRILVTGASGFIGSFIVEQGIAAGYEVWAGIRAGSSRKFLQHPETRFIELNINNEQRLQEQLAAFKKENGTWDYVIHAAGVTK